MLKEIHALPVKRLTESTASRLWGVPDGRERNCPPIKDEYRAVVVILQNEASIYLPD